MRLGWGVYFILVSVYNLVLMLKVGGKSELTISDGFTCLFLLGGFGFSFRLKIFTEKVWRFIFFVALFFYFHMFIFLPFMYLLVKGIPPSKVLNIFKYSIPFIPIIYALFLYSWRSGKIWEAGTGTVE